MQHCDFDTLALMAIGEDISTDAERRHLRDCALCQNEFDQTAAVVATARSVTSDDQPIDPPQEVWTAVRQELQFDRSLRPFVPSGSEGAASSQDEPHNVVSMAEHRAALRRRRSIGTWLSVAAAALGIALGSLATAAVVSGEDQPSGTVIAGSSLSAVQASTDEVAGEATIIERGGERYLDVDVTGLPDGDWYYEVWLIKPDLSGMISLGALSGGSSGQFLIPSIIDVAEYSLVDISLEPDNGDPAHSKDSRARGELSA